MIDPHNRRFPNPSASSIAFMCILHVIKSWTKLLYGHFVKNATFMLLFIVKSHFSQKTTINLTIEPIIVYFLCITLRGGQVSISVDAGHSRLPFVKK